MMRTAGVFLIFAVVTVRGIVVFLATPRFPPLLALLAAYGALLLITTWLIQRRSPAPLSARGQAWALAYLIAQAALALQLLAISDYKDFFALLFIPLSLAAVSMFGGRFGFLCIAGFVLAMIAAFQFSDEGRLFGLAMGMLYSGLCVLFGGYAVQVRRAEAMLDHNRRAFAGLQAVHRQLQGFTDQATHLAVEQERNRLARDLHDSVTQTAFSMNLTAQSTRLLLEKDPSRAADQLLRLETLAANALAEIQTLVTQLRPPSAAEEGLPAALCRLATERQARDGLEINLEISGDNLPLSASETAGLVAITQEALTNVARHSGVQQATVRLDLAAGAAFLEIADRGHGFAAQAVPPRGHLGLAGMAERAREIGWRLQVATQPGQGTAVRVTREQPGGAS